MPSPPPESALRPGEDPREHARVLGRVRNAALTGVDPPVALRPVITASWRRVRDSGLDPRGSGELPLLDSADLEQRRAASGLAPLLPLLRARLLPVAESAAQIMVVVDAEGHVLWREGGAAVRRRADDLRFVEGSAWDENTVGTNAIGTSLVVGAPVHVFAGEHWSEGHQPWTCAAAPLHDPVTGRLLGAVDLSGPVHTVHAGTVALVDAVARLVELELRLAHDRTIERLRVVAAPLLARLTGPALVVSQDGVPAAALDLPVPARVALPESLEGGEVWLPGLGRCTAEPLLGGWLLRPEVPGGVTPDEPVHLLLDLTGESPQVHVTTPSGRWQHTLTPRHAEMLRALARSPEGRSAAQLAADLFGDSGSRVTVRAEMSRLRRTLGPLLQRQPYRIARGVRVELREPAGRPTSA
ncbi:GAF domain-containing protein [Pseudonocardia xinjiangensis]|uniref:helix-turn-helix domain-containing protein n=1 Tax=Pseudonocardia xinjiangensis TaxID=75289 RepID=UPI003D8CC6A4